MDRERLISKWAWILIVGFLIIGWQYPIIGTIAVVCMLASAVVAAWKGGRVWCGNFCPRGSLNDNILNRIGRSVEIPDIFRTVYFRIAFFVFLFYKLTTGLINAQGDWVKIGLVFYRIIFLTTVINIIFGIIFHERTWCSFCPMGSLAAFIIKVKRKLRRTLEGFRMNKSKRITVDEDKCVECNLCEQECPMGLKPYDFTVDSDMDLDCLHCEECVYNCPVGALERK